LEPALGNAKAFLSGIIIQSVQEKDNLRTQNIKTTGERETKDEFISNLTK
tara:strand:- start:4548 stop:4697 length:150 start_codon:yes stop_codon:yes gene_type:complete